MRSRRSIIVSSTIQHEPPWYGTVCPVVWEDGGSNPASYPISFYFNRLPHPWPQKCQLGVNDYNTKTRPFVWT